MAQFDANINVRLRAEQVFKELAKVEKQLKSLESRTLSRAKKNQGLASKLITGGEAAGKNVGTRLLRQQAEAARLAVRLADKRVEKELRLAAALQRQQTILTALTRAGGANSKEAQKRVDAALAAAKANKKNLGIQNGVNALLEKELQIRREINRVESGANEAKSIGATRGAQLRRLSGKGIAASKIDELQQINNDYVAAAERGEADIAKAINRRFKRKFALIQRDIRESDKAAKQEIANQKKIEKATAARRKARRQKFTDVATGFGFPLLFGGGPAQALAGGIGGAFGGLGGSIAASAIVAQFEAFAVGATQAGQALNSTGGALDFMREKSLFSKKEVEEHAAVLEEQGKVAELSALLTKELVDKIGNNGVQALQDLGDTTDETTRLWNDLTLQLAALVAGPLNDFLKLVNNFLGGVTNRARLSALEKDLEGTAAGRELRSEIKELTPTTTFTQQGDVKTIEGALSDAQVKELLDKYTPSRKVTANVPVTAGDERRFAVTDTSADRAAREREKAQALLTKLQQQATLLQDITNDERERLRIQQEYENTITEINQLKDQTFATEQKAIAADIQRLENAKLETEIANRRAEAIRQAVEPIKQIREAQVAANAAAKDYYNLVKSGILPSEAKRVSQFNAQVAAQLRIKDAAINYLETRIATLKTEGGITAQL